MFLTFPEVYFVERSSKPTRQFLRIIVRPEVHKENVRRIRQHVAVKGSYIDTVISQSLDYRIHFTRNQHEVARDRCLTSCVQCRA
jgi:hypothetical protein